MLGWTDGRTDADGRTTGRMGRGREMGWDSLFVLPRPSPWLLASNGRRAARAAGRADGWVGNMSVLARSDACPPCVALFVIGGTSPDETPFYSAKYPKNTGCVNG